MIALSHRVKRRTVCKRGQYSIGGKAIAWHGSIRSKRRGAVYGMIWAVVGGVIDSSNCCAHVILLVWRALAAIALVREKVVRLS